MSMSAFTGFLKGILLQGATDRSIQLAITPGGSTGTATTLTSSQTANRTITLPDASGTILTTGAPISPSQLTPLTPDQAVVTDGSGFLTTSVTTATEIGYVHGVTSNIQTQLNSAAVNPMTTLGDMLYENATPAPTRLPGNITAVKQFLTQTGTGTISAAPVWSTLEDANGNLAANSFIPGYNAIVTSGGTTTLTVASAEQQTLTGSSTQTVNLPATSTLVLGQQYIITNLSTGAVLVTTSAGAGGGSIVSMPANSSATFTCIQVGGTAPAIWSFVLDNALAQNPPMLNPMTTIGDIIYGGTSGVPTRLAAGTSGQFLTSNGAAAPTWRTPLSLVPPGSVTMFAGSSVPSGYLFCDGSSQSTTSFAALFAAIGYTYGGSGTSFNLPNTQGIFVRGVGTQTISAISYTGTLAASNIDHIGSHNHNLLGGANNGSTTPLSNAATTSVCGVTSSGTPNYLQNAPSPGSNPFIEFTSGSTETAPANIAFNYMIKT